MRPARPVTALAVDALGQLFREDRLVQIRIYVQRSCVALRIAVVAEHALRLDGAEKIASGAFGRSPDSLPSSPCFPRTRSPAARSVVHSRPDAGRCAHDCPSRLRSRSALPSRSSLCRRSHLAIASQITRHSVRPFRSACRKGDDRPCWLAQSLPRRSPPKPSRTSVPSPFCGRLRQHPGDNACIPPDRRSLSFGLLEPQRRERPVRLSAPGKRRQPPLPRSRRALQSTAIGNGGKNWPVWLSSPSHLQVKCSVVMAAKAKRGHLRNTRRFPRCEYSCEPAPSLRPIKSFAPADAPTSNAPSNH